MRAAVLALLALALACSPARREDDPPDDTTPDAGDTGTPDAGPIDPEKCGNGVLDANELCDPGILLGPGACPVSCDDGNACTNDALRGNPTLCTAFCVSGPVACQGGDGCCPDGCTSASDLDCPSGNTCGNGFLDEGESCDPAISRGNPGACPTVQDCSDGNVCTADRLVGSANACTATCASNPIASCTTGDGCCPAGCTVSTDRDCGGCGNGFVDEGETCDGNCPTSCDDFDACTTDRRTGSPAQCNVSCVSTPVTSCVSGDGCCPSGCTNAADSDCAPVGCNPACGANQTCENGTCVSVSMLGKPCTTDAQCGTNGACASEKIDGWPQGYCVSTCLTDAECGTNGWCRGTDGFFTQGYCFKTCTSDAACRTGYKCYDRFYESHNVCAPSGNGNLAVGAACTNAAQCAGGTYAICLTAAGSDYKDGYCSLELAQNGTRQCPAGSHLGDISGGYGACLADCTVNSTCRGQGTDGYLCSDSDADGRKECNHAATTATAAIGDPCTGSWNCSGGDKGVCGTVDNGWPGGYCLYDCKSGGCPSGSTCVQLNTSNPDSFFCMKTCTQPGTTTQCRSGYTCRDRGGSTALECATVQN